MGSNALLMKHRRVIIDQFITFNIYYLLVPKKDTYRVSDGMKNKSCPSSRSLLPFLAFSQISLEKKITSSEKISRLKRSPCFCRIYNDCWLV